MPADRLRHKARGLRTADRSISLMKIRAAPKARLEITGCPARHKARALRGAPLTRLAAESCFKYFLWLGEFVSLAREPNIERRQNKDAHCQVDDQASDNDDREGPLRIGADGV
jgi:hypothetical protein